MSKRRNRKTVNSLAWEKTIKDIDPAMKRQMELSFDIVDQIHTYLREKNWNQVQLAEALGKQPSEISKWLTTGHNMTIKTLAKLDIALGNSIVSTPLRAEAKRQTSRFGQDTEHDNYRSLLASKKMEYIAVPVASAQLEPGNNLQTVRTSILSEVDQKFPSLLDYRSIVEIDIPSKTESTSIHTPREAENASNELSENITATSYGYAA